MRIAAPAESHRSVAASLQCFDTVGVQPAKNGNIYTQMEEKKPRSSQLIRFIWKMSVKLECVKLS